MNTWITIWSFVLIASLIAYAILAGIVTIGGFKDVLSMFRTVDQQHKHKKETEPSEQETDT